MIAALTPFAVLAICGLPWLLLARTRVGGQLAAVAVLALLPLLVLVAFFGSRLLGIHPLALLLPLAAVLGLVGAALLVRGRSAVRLPSPRALALWLPAALGGLVWLATLAIARLLPGADVLSWAMNGDSANNIHLARHVLSENGLVPLGNPVPLPSALLAMAMSLGRPEGSAGGELLRHDLEALGVFWALAIAATAVLLGLVASSLLDRARPALIAIASAAGSLLGATWFVSGLPIESGYSNVHVALPIALASWLAFLRSERSPRLSTAVILALGVLLLATWTPLVALTVALTAALVVRNRRRLPRPRPGILVIIVIGAVAVVVGITLLVLPTLIKNAGALGTPGHGYPFTGWLLAVCALVATGGAVGLRRVLAVPLVEGLVAVVVASLAVTVALMAFVPGEQPWTGYYPTKFTYIVTVVVLALALSVLVRRVAQRGAVVAKVTAASVTVLLLCTLGPAPDRQDFAIDQPLARILTSTVWNEGDESVQTVLANTGLDHAVVLWDSRSPDEAMINFWLFEFEGGQLGGNADVRKISIAGYRVFRDTGSYTPPPVAVLCKVVDGLGGPVVVITANPQLEAEIAATCPFASVRVSRE